MRSGRTLRALLVLAALAPVLAPHPGHAQEADRSESLRSLQERLLALRERATRGEVGLLADADPDGPPWLVVDPRDVRNQLALLRLADEIDDAQMSAMASETRRRFATGLRRLNETLAEVELRIRRDGERPTAAESPVNRPRGDPTGDPPPRDRPAASAAQTWEIHLTGVGGSAEDRSLASLSGRLELAVAADGTASGRLIADRDGKPSDVEGSIRDRRVLLRLDLPGGAGEAVLTGMLDATGRHLNGRYRAGSGDETAARGSWRATRQ